MVVDNYSECYSRLSNLFNAHFFGDREMNLIFKMKWFKHLTRSKSDPDIQESEIKFKTQGPYVFWRLLEIMGDEDATDKPLKMNFIVFRNWFPSVTRPKLEKILSYFQHKLRIKWKLNGDDIEIFCFKFSTISSDYSAKVRSKSEQASKLLRKKSVLEVEVDLKKKNKKEKEKKNKDSFMVFWESYHEITGLSKTDKEATFKYWKPLKVDEKEKALKSIKSYFESLRDSKYCKKARTYLRDKNFNDEFKKSQQESVWG